MNFLAALWKGIQVAFAIYQVISERSKKDPAFKAELQRAAGLAKTAKSEKELLDAAQAFQDSLVR